MSNRAAVGSGGGKRGGGRRRRRALTDILTRWPHEKDSAIRALVRGIIGDIRTLGDREDAPNIPRSMASLDQAIERMLNSKNPLLVARGLRAVSQLLRDKHSARGIDYHLAEAALGTMATEKFCQFEDGVAKMRAEAGLDDVVDEAAGAD